MKPFIRPSSTLIPTEGHATVSFGCSGRLRGRTVWPRSGFPGPSPGLSCVARLRARLRRDPQTAWPQLLSVCEKYGTAAPRQRVKHAIASRDSLRGNREAHPSPVGSRFALDHRLTSVTASALERSQFARASHNSPAAMCDMRGLALAREGARHNVAPGSARGTIEYPMWVAAKAATTRGAKDGGEIPKEASP